MTTPKQDLTVEELDHILINGLSGRDRMDVFVCDGPKANEFAPYVMTVPLLKTIIAAARKHIEAQKPEPSEWRGDMRCIPEPSGGDK